MGQKNRKHTFNKKRSLANFAFKNGKKSKIEKNLKSVFKTLQKKNIKKSSFELLKYSIVLFSKNILKNKQTKKKGKRKRIIETNLLLISNKSRFSNALKTLVYNANSNKGLPFEKRISDLILNTTKYSETTTTRTPIDKKLALKFRW